MENQIKGHLKRKLNVFWDLLGILYIKNYLESHTVYVKKFLNIHSPAHKFLTLFS